MYHNYKHHVLNHISLLVNPKVLCIKNLKYSLLFFSFNFNAVFMLIYTVEMSFKLHLILKTYNCIQLHTLTAALCVKCCSKWVNS